MDNNSIKIKELEIAATSSSSLPIWGTGDNDSAVPVKLRKIERSLMGHPKAPDGAASTLDHVITVSVGVQGSLLVWDAQDAVVLQRDRRIQGASVGMFPRVPVQDAFMSLPISLMPDEAAYLRDRKFARFMDEASLVKMPSLLDAAKFHDARGQQVSQQVELYEKLRPRHLDVNKDKVYSRLLRQFLDDAINGNKTPSKTEDEIWEMIRERFLAQSDEENQVINVELPTRSWRPLLGMLKMEEITFEYPVSPRERGLYAAYCSLMDSGFSVTSGANYGADFLAFKGDPHLVYSSYMVKVIEVSAGTSLDDYLRLGRVATTVKKTLLWIMVSEDLQIRFCCSKWALLK